MTLPRKTRIICTIGPATASFEVLEQLCNAGMNVVRLNMSHSDHASAKKIINWIKTLNRKVRYPVPIMLDTQGPEIRTGAMTDTLNLKTGDVIDVTVRDGVDVERQSIHVDYADLVNAVAVGERITVDNGLINLLVLEKSGSHLSCRVLDGGVLKGKRHVDLPGVRVNLPAITDKDRHDIEFAVDNELDFIALSFVRCCAQHGKRVIVATHLLESMIQNPVRCVEQLDQIARAIVVITRRGLMLNRNLVAHRTAFSSDPEKTLATAFEVLREREGFASGEKLVVISDVLAGAGIEAIQIRRIP